MSGGGQVHGVEHRSRPALSGGDLFAFALDSAGKPALTVELALGLLPFVPLLDPGLRAEFRAWLERSVMDDPGFIRQGNLFVVRDRTALRARATRTLHVVNTLEQVLSKRLRGQHRVEALPASAAALARTLMSLDGSAPLTAPSSSGAPRRKRAATIAGDERRRASPAAPARASPAAPARANRPEPPAASVQPSPPARAPAHDPSPVQREAPPRPEVRFASLDAAVVDPATAAATRPVALARVALAIAGHRLALAEQFSELLGPRALCGVDHHRYQIETVRRVLRSLRGRALLADEVGLGKTIEALMILREYQLRGMVRRALVITPPALVRQWAQELAGKGGIEVRTTEDPSARQSPESFFAREGVIVASLATVRTTKIAPAVTATPWDMLIVDEAHRVKNRTTASFKVVDAIKSRFLLLLTATPIESDLDEIYNLVTLLKPGQLTTLQNFRRQFLDAANPTHPKNRETLRRLLGEVMVRNTRASCGLKLPPRFVSTVRVEPLPEEQRSYAEILDLVRAQSTEGGGRLATATLLLEAGSSPAAVADTAAKLATSEKHAAPLRERFAALAAGYRMLERSRKSEALLEVLRAHPERALVFTRYRATLDHVVRTLEASGIRVAGFHGGLDAGQKAAAQAAFAEGRVQVLVATDVGGEGQNLQFCRLLVNYDLPWNPMVIEQRIGRLHRMGQTQEVLVFNLCARGTIEDRVLQVLDERLHLFELVVGEMDMVLGNLADDQDFEARVLDLVSRSKSDAEVGDAFEQLATELESARGRLERAKALDAAVFGEDFEA